MNSLHKPAGSPRFSTQTLSRNTNGRLDRIRLLLQHRAAVRHFENERKIEMKSPEALFSGLSKVRAVIQDAVMTPNWLGNAEPYELILMSTLCASLSPQLVVEFGTFDGLTALHFALNSPDSARIVTLDLHPDDPLREVMTDDTFYSQKVTVGDHFLGTAEERKIDQIFCNTMQFDHSPFRGKADLIFVDAGHAYELVRSDSQKALEMIRPGGVILWHDYHFAHEGVYTYLNELSADTQLSHLTNTKFVCHINT